MSERDDPVPAEDDDLDDDDPRADDLGADDAAMDDEPYPGGGIVRVSLAGTALFTVLGVLGAIWPDVLSGPFLVVSLVEFLVGTVVFVLAFLRAVDRSRTEAIGIGGPVLRRRHRPPSGERSSWSAASWCRWSWPSSWAPSGSTRPWPSASSPPCGRWASPACGWPPTARFPARTPEPTRAGLRDADRRAHRGVGSTDRRERTE